MSHVYVAALIALAVALAWPVPRLLPRLTSLRNAPAAALLLWQSVSLAAITAGLLAAPLAMLIYARGDSTDNPDPQKHLPLLIAGLAMTGFLLVRLLMRGHAVGTQLRRGRREHAELVDLIGLELPTERGVDACQDIRVLTHPTPTAYCVPGASRRVVLTQGTLDALDDDELAAVLAHEQAHLRQRHDLVLEFFTVLHTSVPVQVRSSAGMDEVKLLIELLADRVAVASCGKRPLAKALLSLAEGVHPEATLGASDAAVVRVEQLAYGSDGRGVFAAAMVASVVVLQLPVLLAAATLFAV